MKKQLLIILLTILSVNVNAQKKSKIKGNKQVVDVVKDISNGFNKIEISDDLEINITQTYHNGYTLKTDSNIVDVVKFEVKDSVLKIYTSEKIISSKKLQINLSIKQIDTIILHGSSNLKSVGKLSSDTFFLEGYDSSRFNLDIETKNFSLTLQSNAGGKLKINSKQAVIVMNGRTDLKAYLVADNVKVELNKSAQLSLDGEANTADFNLKEKSELNAKKAKFSDVNLITSNASDVYVYASKNLDIYAEGKSNIYVYGNPKMNVKGLGGKSKIIKK